MKKQLLEIIYFGLFTFAFSCSENAKQPDSATSNPDTSQKVAAKAKILLEPVYYKTAFDMATNFRNEFNSNGTMSDYVWTDLESLRAMVERYTAMNKTHVKIYFGLDTKPICGVPRKNITVFFEGVIAEGECQNDRCNPCELHDDRDTTNLKPYDVAQPCPPPPCGGFSRYYIYRPGEIGKPRAKPFDPSNPTE